MELVILIGIPGSGKTTFCQRHLADTHFRVNLDTLKKRPREARVVQDCIAKRLAIVVDNTNVLALDRARYIPMAKVAGYQINGFLFDCPVEDALARKKSTRQQSLWPVSRPCQPFADAPDPRVAAK